MNKLTISEHLHEAIMDMPPVLWGGDNRFFVIEVLGEMIALRHDVRRVLRLAYGYDGGFDGKGSSYEKNSNGSSVVPDCLVLGNLLKDPPGVAHDMLFYWHHRGMEDPDGYEWTLSKANNWYMRAVADFGYPRLAKIRRLGLFIGSVIPWNMKIRD